MLRTPSWRSSFEWADPTSWNFMSTKPEDGTTTPVDIDPGEPEVDDDARPCVYPDPGCSS